MVGRWPSGAPLIRHPNRDPDRGKREDELPSDAANDRVRLFRIGPAMATNALSGPISGVPIRVIRWSRGRGCQRGTRICTGSSDADGRTELQSRRLWSQKTSSPPRSREGSAACILSASTPTSLSNSSSFSKTGSTTRSFEGLFYNAADPITGAQNPAHREYADTFTVQAAPIRKRVTGLPRFVDVRGGAYFFMPGIRAIKHLSRLPPDTMIAA